jgi:hypothetical protein
MIPAGVLEWNGIIRCEARLEWRPGPIRMSAVVRRLEAHLLTCLHQLIFELEDAPASMPISPSTLPHGKAS